MNLAPCRADSDLKFYLLVDKNVLGPKCVHLTRSVAKYAQLREFCQSLEMENEDGSMTKTGDLVTFTNVNENLKARDHMNELNTESRAANPGRVGYL